MNLRAASCTPTICAKARTAGHGSSGVPQSAKAVLLDIVEKHPKAALLHYGLACCECLLGDIELTKARLEFAVELDSSLKARALDEPDPSGCVEL